MADRLQHYWREKVKPTDLNAHFDKLEAAERAIVADLGLVGVTVGLTLSQAALANLTLQLGAGVAYDKTGRRVAVGSNTQVDCSKDENGVSTAVATPGNKRWVSIFLGFVRAQTDPKSVTDELNNTIVVYYNQAESFRVLVAAGGEGASPARPPLRSDMLLLGDVQLSQGQTAILTSDVNLDRREWTFKTSTGTQIAVGSLKEAIQLLADGVGAVVALSDNIIDSTDDGASRVGFAVDNDGTTNLAQGTVRSAILAVRNAFSTHVNSASAHAAANLTYAGSGQWKDGTTIGAGSVEAAIDSIVTGLAATSAPNGGLKIGLGARSNWKDSTTNPATDVYTGINKIVEDLAANTGAAKIGFNGSGNWADATTNPAASVEAQLDKIVSDLSGTSGAAKIGATASGGVTGATVQAQINSLDSTKVTATTLAAGGGAALVGATATGGLAGTTVQAQLNGLDSAKASLTSLAASTGTTLIGGAAKAGTSFSLTAGTVKAQLEELLTHVNAARPDIISPTNLTLADAGLNHGGTAGSQSLQYAKDNGNWGHVLGTVTWGGSGTWNGTVATLPSGTRPTRTMDARLRAFDVAGFAGDTTVDAYIETDGRVVVNSLPSGYGTRLNFPPFKAV